MDSFTGFPYLHPRNSTSSARRGLCYEYPTDRKNLVYIQEPATRHTKTGHFLPHTLSQTTESKKKSKVKKFCKGIFNVFRSKHSNIGCDEESRRESAMPATYYPHWPHSSTSFFAPSPLECTSLMNLSGYEDETRESDGEYLIYLPRISRTKLQRTVLDPLRSSMIDPVIIQPASRISSHVRGNPLGDSNAAGDGIRLKTAVQVERSAEEYSGTSQIPRKEDDEGDNSLGELDEGTLQASFMQTK